MKHILIALNPSKDKDGVILSNVISKVSRKFNGVKIKVLNSYELAFNEIDDDTDLVIVLGGDGTILSVARDLNGYKDIPILGVNIGNLGFLSSVEYGELESSLEKIKKGLYTKQKRILLQCNTGKNSNVLKALNDVVIARGTLSRIIKFDIYIDKKLYISFKGDGLIVATPTGSTAYSFSAGGPFIYPDVDVVTITPICPHTKAMQPIVLNSSSVIEINVDNNNEEIYLTVDGQKVIKKEDDEIITITKSEHCAEIILLDDYDYFNVLRKKILNNSEKEEGE